MTRRSALSLGAMGMFSAVARAQQTEKPRVLAADGHAYRLGATEQVAGPGTRLLGVAPRGRYILSLHHKRSELLPEPEGKWTPADLSLNLWDTKLHKSKTLWRYSETVESRVHPNLIAWLSPTMAVIECNEQKKETSGGFGTFGSNQLLIVNCGSVSVKPIPWYSGGLAIVRIMANPVRPVAVMPMATQFNASLGVIYLLGASGVTKSYPILSTTDYRGWSRDGNRFYISRPDKESPKQERWSALDLNLNEMPLANKPNDIVTDPSEEKEKLALPIRCIERTAIFTVGGSREKLASLWLASSDGLLVRVVAEIDTDSWELLPDLSAVVYQYQSALYVTPLAKLGTAK